MKEGTDTIVNYFFFLISTPWFLKKEHKKQIKNKQKLSLEV